ncbi:MAG: XRE family transcriptional regulator [Desulfuromonadales bacterium]|jgi:transcriptional regulator with XRE-family HTH domain|nr:XRE family transcriptional regulator [Desulfuromonadales bacterium]MDH3961302.1 XRE family transcriptional regulator [Desulfuromonadales bacterium]MDH4025284.1 XRE family transcriptional regulator [Desulfuromonadales bacterium]HKJ28965.1 XRE family transcriptional regulator [Desulfuromonadales bacterium]
MSVDYKIGEKLRQLREAKQMTVELLAEQSQCHADQIRQIENGALVPSLTPLMEISRALGVRLGTLLDDDPIEGPVVFKSTESPTVIRFSGKDPMATSSNLDFYSMGSGKRDRHMEPFIIDVKPRNGEAPPLSAHEGEEFIYVLSGAIQIYYGKNTYELETGESIYYDSVVPHDVHAKGSENARILAVVYAPS